eukprot:scaffold33956_cov29-Tisochrysis_lutea.AAC.9
MGVGAQHPESSGDGGPPWPAFSIEAFVSSWLLLSLACNISKGISWCCNCPNFDKPLASSRPLPAMSQRAPCK